MRNHFTLLYYTGSCFRTGYFVVIKSDLKLREIARELLCADGEDLLAVNLDFDAERGANVAALHDGAANPDVAGQVDGPKRIVKGVSARIAHKRVSGVAIVVILAELVEIADIFELAVAVGSFAGESPIAGRDGGGTGGKPDNGGGNEFSGHEIADEEVGGRP